MSFKRMWALFVARNFEFIRDRAGFGWNILFPFLIVAGFGVRGHERAQRYLGAAVQSISNRKLPLTIVEV